jgi:hypothetical protein
MKQFIKNPILFILPIIAVFVIGLCLPTTPRASKSLLMANKNKNLLLQKTPSPRIIFVGGSNLSFGLNSQMIKDTLRLNPINTAIHAGIGIKFMLDNTLGYVQKGDIVILAPEYSHFYVGLNLASQNLLRMIFDVDLHNIKHLNALQIYNIIPHLPKYSLTKFSPDEYFNVKEDEVYSVNSFNQYGDTYTHWTMKQEEFSTESGAIKGEFNDEIIKFFEEFSFAVKQKGGNLLVTFPSLQETAYNNSIEQIKKIEKELLRSNLEVIGTSERYKMPNSFMFNSSYHLNKIGVDYRTKRIMDDIKKARTNSKNLP